MKVEIEPPAERTVAVELKESEAAFLMEVLEHVYNGPVWMRDLKLELAGASLVPDSWRVESHPMGLRAFDNNTEW